MSRYNVTELFSRIEEVVRSDLPVAEGLHRVVRYCARQRPHRDWGALLELDVAADVARMREWLHGALPHAPPPADTTRLWFGLFHPLDAEGNFTTDLHLAADTEAAPTDWPLAAAWHGGAARSSVLAALHRVAFGTDTGLGNSAEYPLGLAYAALVARQLSRDLGTALLGAAPRCALVAGFDAGDTLRVGELRPEGLVFS